ncbi:MAG: dienelactone hydrolase family protein [Gemmatimonadetes bacterium]|nr:dienelactone hydrolase family protein [Gemmatimonadota bacterium]
MKREQSSDFDPDLLHLFDKYVHGGISRREFLDGAARFAVGGMTAQRILERLSPNYGLAREISEGDPRLEDEYITYPAPLGHGSMRAYLARPAQVTGRLPGVIVVHENRGLNPYIEDVSRRLAVANFLALAPDGLTPVGGYPGDEDRGRELQSSLDPAQLVEDFVAAAVYLMGHPECTGRVGVVGFCYGGGVANTLAVRLPNLGAAVPFYGRQPTAAQVAQIKAPLLIQYAEDDQGVNSGWPAFEAALKANDVLYTAYVYEGTMHGFHNNTTPRYNEAAARLAWERTIAFFNQTLR